MNMKKMKKFFTLSRRAEGFTLVELIVVIAILAILGGVAVPAYGGYVKKADEAADAQLLADVNKAFISACMMNGVDNFNTNAAAVLAEGAVTEVSAANVADFNASFQTFFDNEGKFKNVTALLYSQALGAFEAGQSFGNGVVISNANLEKIKASIWATNPDLTSEDILNMVADTLDNVETVYGDSYYGNMIDSPEFKAAAAAALGVADYDQYVADKAEAAAKAKYEAENPGKSWDDLDPKQDKQIINKYTKEARTEVESNLNKNMAIVVAAQGAQEQSGVVLDMLKNDASNTKKNIQNTLMGESTSTEGLSQAAVAYGLYHSYIYGREDLTAEEKEQMTAPGYAMNDLDNPEFLKYLETEQAQADLDGLLASMDVISGQDTTVTDTAVNNGVNNEDMVGALEDVLGK